MLEEKPRINHLFRHSLHPRNLLMLFLLCASLLLPLGSKANPLFQDIPVTVIDTKTGEPLIGVNIYTEDTRFFVSTDIDGKAVLSDLGYRDVVVFSYIGYKDLKLPIYEIRNKKGRILMEEDISVLDEVVIIGRRDDPIQEIPYQIERISSKEIQFSNAQTAADLLEKNGNLFVQKSQMGGGSVPSFEALKPIEYY